MIRAIVQYLRDEGTPRWRSIVLTPETFFSIFVGIAFALFGERWFSEYPKVSDLTTGLIAYTAIALGFCVAGLTISLTLPSRRFSQQIANSAASNGGSHYSNLLFVFSWTAVAHWIALILLFIVVLFVDSSKPLALAGQSSLRSWMTGCLACICMYCLFQFLITLITLSQVGATYIRFLRNDGEHHANEQD